MRWPRWVVGAVGVRCRTCGRGYSYRVYIAYGEGGWFAEIEGATNGALISARGRDGEVLRGDLLKDTLLAWVNDAAEGTRIEIAPP